MQVVLFMFSAVVSNVAQATKLKCPIGTCHGLGYQASWQPRPGAERRQERQDPPPKHQGLQPWLGWRPCLLQGARGDTYLGGLRSAPFKCIISGNCTECRNKQPLLISGDCKRHLSLSNRRPPAMATKYQPK